MQAYTHALTGLSANIPLSAHVPILSYGPIILPSPNRLVDMEIRVTAPTEGCDLPLVVLSHGHGYSHYLSSLEGYAPTVEFLASHGFVVVQPTHLDSAYYNFTPPAYNEYFYQSRPEDIIHLLDAIDNITASVPTLKGRVDNEKWAVIGHSLGGWTAQLLLGAQNTDPRNNKTVNLIEKRFKTGVVMSGLGRGGDSLSESGKEEIPDHNPNFRTMITPALIIFGELDQTAHLTIRPNGEWHADSYFDSAGPKALMNITGGLHMLGGVSGWDTAEAEGDENVERVQMTLRMIWSYLRSHLYENDSSWDNAVHILNSLPKQLALVQQKE